ncbi:HNH endonuclease [Tardiphaga sp. 538_B7_N1_4]|uniref:HNH endonuclease n=1 Tax=Tardiphaga sp. 538_B7_N1_4 TaxID=3240778 RepID=UPI003F2482A1
MTATERLDGANGLLLAPHVDRLFDRGLISFQASGEVLVSSRRSLATIMIASSVNASLRSAAVRSLNRTPTLATHVCCARRLPAIWARTPTMSSSATSTTIIRVRRTMRVSRACGPHAKFLPMDIRGSQYRISFCSPSFSCQPMKVSGPISLSPPICSCGHRNMAFMLLVT